MRAKKKLLAMLLVLSLVLTNTSFPIFADAEVQNNTTETSEEVNNEENTESEVESVVLNEEDIQNLIENGQLIDSTEDNSEEVISTEEITESSEEDTEKITEEKVSEVETEVVTEEITEEITEEVTTEELTEETSEEVSEELSEEETTEEREGTFTQFIEGDTDGISFETKELLIGTEDPSIFTWDTEVLSEYNGVYLVRFNTEDETRNAYLYYQHLADFVSVNSVFEVQDEEYVDDSADLSNINNNDDALSILNDMDIDTVPNKTIALIDTGVNTNNVIDKVSVIGDFVSDENGHGTEMYNYIIKEAPNAKIISIKAVGADGRAKASDIYAALQYAIEAKVDIINLSISANNVEENNIIVQTIEEAIEKGITVVGAAGNNGSNAKYFIPGCIDKAVIVSAIDENYNLKNKANYGETVDFYVIANSTSEATAKMTGYIYTNNISNGKVIIASEEDIMFVNDKSEQNATDEFYTDADTNELTLTFNKHHYQVLNEININLTRGGEIKAAKTTIFGTTHLNASKKHYILGSQISVDCRNKDGNLNTITTADKVGTVYPITSATCNTTLPTGATFNYTKGLAFCCDWDLDAPIQSFERGHAYRLTNRNYYIVDGDDVYIPYLIVNVGGTSTKQPLGAYVFVKYPPKPEYRYISITKDVNNADGGDTTSVSPEGIVYTLKTSNNKELATFTIGNTMYNKNNWFVKSISIKNNDDNFKAWKDMKPTVVNVSYGDSGTQKALRFTVADTDYNNYQYWKFTEDISSAKNKNMLTANSGSITPKVSTTVDGIGVSEFTHDTDNLKYYYTSITKKIIEDGVTVTDDSPEGIVYRLYNSSNQAVAEFTIGANHSAQYTYYTCKAIKKLNNKAFNALNPTSKEITYSNGQIKQLILRITPNSSTDISGYYFKEYSVPTTKSLNISDTKIPATWFDTPEIKIQDFSNGQDSYKYYYTSITKEVKNASGATASETPNGIEYTLYNSSGKLALAKFTIGVKYDDTHWAPSNIQILNTDNKTWKSMRPHVVDVSYGSIKFKVLRFTAPDSYTSYNLWKYYETKIPDGKNITQSKDPVSAVINNKLSGLSVAGFTHASDRIPYYTSITKEVRNAKNSVITNESPDGIEYTLYNSSGKLALAKFTIGNEMYDSTHWLVKKIDILNEDNADWKAMNPHVVTAGWGNGANRKTQQILQFTPTNTNYTKWFYLETSVPKNSNIEQSDGSVPAIIHTSLANIAVSAFTHATDKTTADYWYTSITKEVTYNGKAITDISPEGIEYTLYSAGNNPVAKFIIGGEPKQKGDPNYKLDNSHWGVKQIIILDNTTQTFKNMNPTITYVTYGDSSYLGGTSKNTHYILRLQPDKESDLNGYYFKETSVPSSIQAFIEKDTETEVPAEKFNTKNIGLTSFSHAKDITYRYTSITKSLVGPNGETVTEISPEGTEYTLYTGNNTAVAKFVIGGEKVNNKYTVKSIELLKDNWNNSITNTNPTDITIYYSGHKHHILRLRADKLTTTWYFKETKVGNSRIKLSDNEIVLDGKSELYHGQWFRTNAIGINDFPHEDDQVAMPYYAAVKKTVKYQKTVDNPDEVTYPLMYVPFEVYIKGTDSTGRSANGYQIAGRILTGYAYNNTNNNPTRLYTSSIQDLQSFDISQGFSWDNYRTYPNINGQVDIGEGVKMTRTNGVGVVFLGYYYEAPRVWFRECDQDEDGSLYMWKDSNGRSRTVQIKPNTTSTVQAKIIDYTTLNLYTDYVEAQVTYKKAPTSAEISVVENTVTPKAYYIAVKKELVTNENGVLKNQLVGNVPFDVYVNDDTTAQRLYTSWYRDYTTSDTYNSTYHHYYVGRLISEGITDSDTYAAKISLNDDVKDVSTTTHSQVSSWTSKEVLAGTGVIRLNGLFYEKPKVKIVESYKKTVDDINVWDTGCGEQVVFDYDTNTNKITSVHKLTNEEKKKIKKNTNPVPNVQVYTLDELVYEPYVINNSNTALYPEKLDLNSEDYASTIKNYTSTQDIYFTMHKRANLSQFDLSTTEGYNEYKAFIDEHEEYSLDGIQYALYYTENNRNPWLLFTFDKYGNVKDIQVTGNPSTGFSMVAAEEVNGDLYAHIMFNTLVESGDTQDKINMKEGSYRGIYYPSLYIREVKTNDNYEKNTFVMHNVDWDGNGALDKIGQEAKLAYLPVRAHTPIIADEEYKDYYDLSAPENMYADYINNKFYDNSKSPSPYITTNIIDGTTKDYTTNPGITATQMANYFNDNAKSYIQIHKTPTNNAFVDGNPNYCLESTKFEVYLNKLGTEPLKNTDGENVVLIVNSNGYTNIEEISSEYVGQTVYIKEISGANTKNYYTLEETLKLDKALESGTNVFDIKNDPKGDPVSINVQKNDANNNSQINDTVKVTATYYPADTDANYTTIEQLDANCTPITKEIEFIGNKKLNPTDFSADFKLDGTPSFPYGYLVISEIEAPKNYNTNPTWKLYKSATEIVEVDKLFIKMDSNGDSYLVNNQYVTAYIPTAELTTVMAESYTPEIATNMLSSETNTKLGLLRENERLRDTIYYWGIPTSTVEPKTITFRGQLFDADGNVVTLADGTDFVQKTITVTASSYNKTNTGYNNNEAVGESYVDYVFDSRKYKGMSLHSVITVIDSDVELLVHNDELQDELETVYYIDGNTSAYDDETETDIMSNSETAVINDKFFMKNVVIGNSYRIEASVQKREKDGTYGVLMDNGNPVTKTIHLNVQRNASNEIEVTVADNNATVLKVTDKGTTCDIDLLISFTVNASILEDVTTTVFERVYFDDYDAFEHEDIDNQEQQVHFAKIRTNLYNTTTGTNLGLKQADEELVDIITFNNLPLTPGLIINFTGKLMNKATHSVMIDSNGNEIIESVQLLIDDEGNISSSTGISGDVYNIEIDETTNTFSGDIRLRYNYDSSDFEEVTLVSFVHATYYNGNNGVDIAIHDDYDDLDETVYYLTIHTDAKDKFTKKQIAKTETTTIVDRVTTENLVCGHDYFVTGEVHKIDKNGNNIGVITTKTVRFSVDDNGNITNTSSNIVDSNVTQTYKTADNSKVLTIDGYIDIEFNINSSELMGYDTVVCETIGSEDYNLDVHNDLTDKRQTVHIPDGGTTAMDEKTKDDVGTVEENGTIKLPDTVALSNLLPNETYYIEGILMEKLADGTAQVIEVGEDKHNITSSCTFRTTNNAITSTTNEVKSSSVQADGTISGSIIMNFEFSSKDFGNRNVVVYEYCYILNEDNERVEIFKENDIKKLGQTVHFPEVTTLATDVTYDGNVGIVSENAQLIENSELFNLVYGKEYVVIAKLYNQFTGEPIKDTNNNNIEKSVLVTVSENGSTVTATNLDRSGNYVVKDIDKDENDNTLDVVVEIPFTYNSIPLSGKATVVFEELYHNNVKVNSHTDINDIKEQVHYYGLHLTKKGVDDPSKVVFVLQNNGADVLFTKVSDGVYNIAFEGTLKEVSPDANGNLTINGFNADSYTFTEVKTASGKNLLAEAFTLTFTPNSDEDGALKEVLCKTKNKQMQLSLETEDNRTLNMVNISIDNNNTIHLNTGGNGVAIYYILSMMLLCVAIGIIYRKKRR